MRVPPDILTVPLVGEVGTPTVNTSPSMSVALASTSVLTLPASSTIVAVSPASIGASLVQFTVTTRIEVAHACGVPLSHVCINTVSTPAKFGSGVYVTFPAPSMLAVPFVGVALMLAVKASPSTSVSLVNTFVTTLPPSSVAVAVSSTATGASLTAVTVTITVVVLHKAGTPVSHAV